jgi:hypothetical protein
MTLQGVREFQFQLDLEEGESKLKDSSKELLCQEGRIGTGGIRMEELGTLELSSVYKDGKLRVRGVLVKSSGGLQIPAMFTDWVTKERWT